MLCALPCLTKYVTCAHELFQSCYNKSSIEYRAGVKVEMKSRPVTCHAIQCVQFSPPSFTLDVHCGGGFYIRSLVHDLGNGKESMHLLRHH